MRTFEEMLGELGPLQHDPVAARAWYGGLSDEERQVFQKGVADMLKIATDGLKVLRQAVGEAMSGMSETLSDAMEPMAKAIDDNPDLMERVRECAQMVRDAGFDPV